MLNGLPEFIFLSFSASLSDSIMTTMGICTLMYSGLLHWSRQLVNLNLANRFVNLVILLALHAYMLLLFFFFFFEKKKVGNA
jgi:hypothetical protein